MRNDETRNLKPKLRGFGPAYLLLVFAAVFSVYSPSLDNGLIGDGLGWAESAWRGGAGHVFPFEDWTDDDWPAYWFRRYDVGLLLESVGGRIDIYQPPLPKAVMVLEAWLWGGWSAGYHLVNLVLHAAAACLLGLLLLRLGGRRWQVLVAGLIYALHPVLVAPAILVMGLPFLLAALFGLSFLLAAACPETGFLRRVAAPAFLLLALSSDAGALAFLAVFFLLGSRLYKGAVFAPGRGGGSGGRDLAIAALAFFFVRYCLPMKSGAFSAEGYYSLLGIERLTEQFAMPLHDLFYWTAFMPPQALPLSPLSAYLSLAAIPLFLGLGFYRALRVGSHLAAAGLCLYFTAAVIAFAAPVRPEAAAVPAAGLALLSVDLLAWCFAAGRLRHVRIVAVILYALIALPQAVYLNLTSQQMAGFIGRTGERLARGLAGLLSDAPPNSRVYLLNQWGGAPLLPLHVPLLMDRPDLVIRTLTTDPAPVPKGLPYPGGGVFSWAARYAEVFEQETKLAIYVDGPRTLRVGLERGGFLMSIGDLSPVTGLVVLPEDLRFTGDGFSVSAETGEAGYVDRLTFNFEEDLQDPGVLAVVWREGRWQRLDLK